MMAKARSLRSGESSVVSRQSSVAEGSVQCVSGSVIRRRPDTQQASQEIVDLDVLEGWDNGSLTEGRPASQKDGMHRGQVGRIAVHSLEQVTASRRHIAPAGDRPAFVRYGDEGRNSRIITIVIRRREI